MKKDSSEKENLKKGSSGKEESEKGQFWKGRIRKNKFSGKNNDKSWRQTKKKKEAESPKSILINPMRKY